MSNSISFVRILLLVGGLLSLTPQAWAAFEVVSLNSKGEWGGRGVYNQATSISADGRYLVFNAVADNLIPDDHNNATDVFLLDRVLGATIRVSVASDGTEGNGLLQVSDNIGYNMSADGRYIVFTSDADNLLGPGVDTNRAPDVFLHDTQTGTTTLISRPFGGGQANSASWGAAISGDGNHIVFKSWATNLVVPSTPGFNIENAFVYHRTTGEIELINFNSKGDLVPNATSGLALAINDDGSYVAFLSREALTEQTNGALNIFVRDIKNKKTFQVSVSDDGGPLNGDSYQFPSINDNGCRVAFASYATNGIKGRLLKPGPHIYVRDWCQSVNFLVTQNTAGEEASFPEGVIAGGFWGVAISGDGNRVVFQASAMNLNNWGKPPDPIHLGSSVYLRDLKANTTQVISVTLDGNLTDSSAGSPYINRDGSVVVFSSAASNLVPGGTQENELYLYHNIPPISLFQASYSNDTQKFQFDSTSSRDPDGGLLSYHWDFGDGSFSTEKNPSHAYEIPGNYLIKLTVTDNGYEKNTSQQTIASTVTYALSGGGFSCSYVGMGKRLSIGGSCSWPLWGAAFVLLLRSRRYFCKIR